MASYTIDKVEYGSNTYNLQDNTSGYTKNTGTVTSIGITAGTGISVSGSPITSSGSITVGHSNSVTAGTAGTSSATSGVTLAVPYVTYDAQGHITGSGTHTHTISAMTTTEIDTAIAAATT